MALPSSYQWSGVGGRDLGRIKRLFDRKMKAGSLLELGRMADRLKLA
jgi:hypothetical protein